MAGFGQDPRGRAKQIGRDMRGARHLPVVARELGLAVPGSHENAPRAHRFGQADVGRFVANHEGPAEIDGKLRLRLPDEARLRLAALALRPQRVDRGLRMMRAIEPAVDARARSLDGGRHLFVDPPYKRIRTEA